LRWEEILVMADCYVWGDAAPVPTRTLLLQYVICRAVYNPIPSRVHLIHPN
ncbi:hypothetical protein J6590_004869, partial [Homalodisca vitripennis]